MIQLQSTPARIGLTTNHAQYTIQQQKADLQIEQPKAKLDISKTSSSLSIDQSKAWYDMDLKNVLERTREAADRGHQDWLAGLERVARQGDELMHIENKGNPLVTQALENSTSPELEFNYGTLPANPFRVELKYTPASVEVNWERKDPNIRVITRPPEFTYQRGKVDVYLAQKNTLSISYNESKVDQKI